MQIEINSVVEFKISFQLELQTFPFLPSMHVERETDSNKKINYTQWVQA